ncbi:MAG: UDP-2,3-diacylglucosamine diphosphatase [Gammaproteobacteria bacterium]|nr:UDP-2,3-diacylglucosamine diphosphatase [Gammaproteobacteria bacterium]
MKEEILFISDLHLALDKPDITKRFVRFLDTRAPRAKALYILGDLFDAWVGDDDFTPPGSTVRKKLRQLADSGTDIFLQLGNRDFLLGQAFCEAAGCTLLPDYAVIELFGNPTLLMHGDLLCTDDLPYQEFRIKSRTAEWRDNVLGKPLIVRLLAARWYRLSSFWHKQKKSQDIMDVNQDTVINTMTEYRCYNLIHGHTHRPNVHTFTINDRPARRFVLSDWSAAKGEALVWRQNSYSIEAI